jgi:hypothetical protein
MSEFDFEKRRQERSKEKERQADRSKGDMASLASETKGLSESINRYYGSKSQFDHSTKGSTITLTKKGGGSSLTIEVLGKGRFKLSGGSGPDGLNADVGQSMEDVSKEDMMDTVDEWFAIKG